MLNDTPQWVALYTNPRAEKATAKRLQDLGYETYLPLQRKLHRWSDRWKSVEVPLLPSYLFVKMRITDVVPILGVNGVSFIVSWHNKPGVIPDNEIESMRRMVDADAQIHVMNDSELKKGAHVRITEGQFAGMEGTLITNCQGGNFGISISGLNFALVMDIESAILQPIKEEKRTAHGLFDKKAICLAFIFMASFLTFNACSKDDEPEPPATDLPLAEAYITDSTTLSPSGLKVYNFVYPSTDPYGDPIMLSGAITLSSSITRQAPARGMLLYNHFTVYRADQCPSRGELDMQTRMAPSGLITVSADYYGFGVTNHHHQAYCISAVNAQASIDALLAARKLLSAMGYSWDDPLFNAGYSQGGQTTVAVLRLVAQKYPDIDFTYSFAGAGSYDIPETYRQFVDTTIAGMPSTVISVLLSYNEFLRLGIPHEEIFTEHVLSHIDDWIYSKRYTREEIDAKVGSLSIFQYATPAVTDTSTTLARRFFEAFESDNLCRGWQPRGTEHIMLFHNSKDITVPIANTHNLYNFLTANGVEDIDLQTIDFDGNDVTPAHEAGAIFFGMLAVNKLSEILGIDPWSLF